MSKTSVKQTKRTEIDDLLRQNFVWVDMCGRRTPCQIREDPLRPEMMTVVILGVLHTISVLVPADGLVRALPVALTRSRRSNFAGHLIPQYFLVNSPRGVRSEKIRDARQS